MEKREFLLKNVVVNYAYVNRPDDHGLYRVSFAVDEDMLAMVKQALPEDYPICTMAGKIPGELITAKSSFPVIKAYDKAVTNKEIYSGCVCDIVINAYDYVYKRKVGVAFGLKAVCKRAEGERLDNRKSATDYFGEDVTEAWVE